ncbi:MAG: PrpF domain-containing protein [Paracoccaceae bacterium]
MLDQLGVRATFMRGGTSKGLFFRWEDVPEDRDAFLIAAIGSGDPYGRQLDGMGGGVSSLSKAMMVRRSERDGIDIDYLFAQAAIREARIDYAANCGNLSSAVGCFAVDQGLVQLPDGPGVVRMYNENTSKQIDCHLTVRAGRAAVTGSQDIAGVPGSGSSIRLDFRDPGGAGTGDLLPLGTPQAAVEGISLSFVDAANPCLFVHGQDLGVTAAHLPAEIEANAELMAHLESLRAEAGAQAGMAAAPGAPKIALVSPPAEFRTLTGETLPAEACDVLVRMVSMGAPHLAIPLTGAMAVAVAARISGTVVHEVVGNTPAGTPLRIGTASGVVPAMAEVTAEPRAVTASVYRTARMLMEGTVFAPEESCT